ncbi:adenylate/guanylate cyclase domain-containing protein [Actinoplanes sp. NPDC049599]|uniref:adenylate/guanylate cyclase domain-containing protein n=1 Tax=Actinoplanes sp. NPDC049599 TaxID=3363903 RepID=UPI0037A1F071
MSRRLVVVLFLDLVGWTRLAERVDPEPLQMLMERYYEICSSAVEDHGGVVEKFIGDAIMAVFGADTAQEDDALRALGAAFEIRTDVGELRDPGATVPPFEIHCGIAAGEALVARSPRAGLRVVGDVVNLAARLQSAAVSGEILVNDTVARLARTRIALMPVTPLTLKGKTDPVPAWRVTGADDDHRPADGQMVDRTVERARILDSYRWVADRRRARTVAVLGPPGIGKTRLVHEALGELDAVVAVVGTCPSYGPHGAWVALNQILEAVTRQAPRSQQLVLADSRIATVLAGLRDAALSRRPGAAPGPAVDEVYWAAREVLAAACDRPLVVVWDSLEWAGETLLRLIGELIDGLPDLPLLTVCVARPELTVMDLPWLCGLGERDLIEVGALAPADSAVLAASLAGATDDAEVLAHTLDLADRAAVYGAGNPLFIKLVLEAVPGGPVEQIPPTITAMVGAMIDRLPAAARQLLVAASVVGLSFTVEELACIGEPVPAAAFDALLRRWLISPAEDGHGYRFVQQPVHEVAYGRLEKERRLAWHRRLAEHDVSPAFHFEAATRLLNALRPRDPELGALVERAATALLAEGTAALRQRDIPTAVGVLGRAVNLPGGSPRWRVLATIRLSDALMLSGELPRAMRAVAACADHLPCQVQQHLLAVRAGRIPEATVAALLAALRADETDRLAWCRFEQLRMLLLLNSGSFGAAEQAAVTALGHARAIGDVYEEDRLLAAVCEIRQWSPTPVRDTLAGCQELLVRFAADRFLLVPVLAVQARCLALTGDHAGALAALAEAGAAADQLRLSMGRILIDQAAGMACSLRGDHVGAERHHRWAADRLVRGGHATAALTSQVQAARARARQQPPHGTAAEIITLLDRRDDMDVRGEILCLSAAVRLAARDNRAETLMGDMLTLLDRTDDACLRGEVYFDLAQAHRHLGHHAEADAMAGAAIDSFATVGATRPLATVTAWR